MTGERTVPPAISIQRELPATATREEIEAVVRELGLDVDGEVGPHTWAALRGST